MKRVLHADDFVFLVIANLESLPSTFIETIWADAVEFEPNAGRARPCVGRGCIALDLSPSATLTSSHDYIAIQSVVSTGTSFGPVALEARHTLEALVAVVLIYKYIIWSRGCCS